MREKKLRPIALALASALAIQGCATTGKLESVKESFKQTFSNDDPCANSKRNIGIALGAITGAIIASQISGDKNKAVSVLVGLAAGGGFGAFIGADIDKRACEISKIQKKYDASIQVTPINFNAGPTPIGTKTAGQEIEDKLNNLITPKDNVKPVGLSVNVTDKQGQPQFESGSDVLSQKTREMFKEIARQYNAPSHADDGMKNKETAQKTAELVKLRRILLIGHTDDTGSSTANSNLSERRAVQVAKLFEEAGIQESQIYYQGAGETLPMSDNATEEGRASNRRVEIVDLGNEEAFNLYLQNKRANTQYYRPINKSSTSTVIAAENFTSPAKEKIVAKDKADAKAASTVVIFKSNSTKEPSSKPYKYRDLLGNIIDFGGTSLTAFNSSVDAGLMTQVKPIFSFINEAQASDMTKISSCSFDRPRDSGPVRSLNNGKVYSTSEHYPGLDGRTWSDMVGGNLVVLNNVAVLRDGSSIPKLPTLKVYTNYNPSKNKNPKADIDIKPSVNVYQGSNGIIYRVFAQGDRGVQCMDVLMPTNSAGISKAGKIVYGLKDNILVADFKPKRLK